ncbi:hypothetical protein [Georgenia sp. SUBG003]|uniref:hypothetical protein n=1 Tax=Georgenia sp. SUBG003 TaxID=1497974 RepID=UPI003AB32701
MEVAADEEQIVERVAALDIGKGEVVCCARVPGPHRRRMQEVRTVATMTADLLALADWLGGPGGDPGSDGGDVRLLEATVLWARGGRV